MNTLMHFEIHADDLERAVNFYRKVFGWNMEKFDGDPRGDYWFISPGEEKSKASGVSGGIHPRVGTKPPADAGPNAFSCSIQVEDLEASAKKVKEAGGKVIEPPYSIPGMTWQFFRDTEGNIFGMGQQGKE